MSSCKCPGVPRGQPHGMAIDKCIMRTFVGICCKVIKYGALNLPIFKDIYIWGQRLSCKSIIYIPQRFHTRTRIETEAQRNSEKLEKLFMERKIHLLISLEDEADLLYG